MSLTWGVGDPRVGSGASGKRLARHGNLEHGVFYIRPLGEDRLPGRNIGYSLNQIRNAAWNLLRTLDAPSILDARRQLAARKDLGLPLVG